MMLILQTLKQQIRSYFITTLMVCESVARIKHVVSDRNCVVFCSTQVLQGLRIGVAKHIFCYLELYSSCFET